MHRPLSVSQTFLLKSGYLSWQLPLEHDMIAYSWNNNPDHLVGSIYDVSLGQMVVLHNIY